MIRLWSSEGVLSLILLATLVVLLSLATLVLWREISILEERVRSSG